MSQASFDLEIKGLKFTLAPVCANEGECNQYSVMSEEYIFRMLYDAATESFRISKVSNIPADLLQFEGDLSNAIINNGETGEKP